MQTYGYLDEEDSKRDQIECHDYNTLPVRRLVPLATWYAHAIQVETSVTTQLSHHHVTTFLFMANNQSFMFEFQGSERKLLSIHVCRAFRYTLGQQAENAFCPLG